MGHMIWVTIGLACKTKFRCLRIYFELEPPREQSFLSLKLFLSSAAAIAAFHVSYLNSSCN
jgi:hypothetical protein